MKCKTKFCRGVSTRSGHSPYCSKCRARRWKEAHPIAYAFNKLRFRAKERGHSFGLTLYDFTDLWNKGLGVNRRRNGHCVSIDRIDPSRGYHADNVQIMTVSENARKRYVPYFANKEQEEDAIRQAEAEVRAAYAGEI